MESWFQRKTLSRFKNLGIVLEKKEKVKQRNVNNSGCISSNGDNRLHT